MNALQPIDAVPRWSLLRGRHILRALREDPVQEYFIYVPHTATAGSAVLVSVHGVSRNAYEQSRMLAPFCEKLGVVLVVPHFTREHNPDYQRLGREGRGGRADRVLDRCLREAASLTGADASRLYLFGYSGGAQFVHRYVMAHPSRVQKAVVAAAGWYTFPDHRRRYPYGIRASRSLPGVNFNPEEFLRIPVEVIVGGRDVEFANLRTTERLNRQQGRTRVERARNWAAAMQGAAGAYGVEPAVTFTEVPDVDHSFRRFCERGALIRRIFSSLFLVGVEFFETDTEGGPASPVNVGLDSRWVESG